MNVRSLVSLIVLFALVTAAVWVSQLNRDAVTLRLPGLAPLSAPLWVVVFLTLLLGVFLALLYSLALSSRQAMVSWRQGRNERGVAVAAAALEVGIRELAREDAAAALEQLEAAVSADGSNAEAWLFAGDAARRVGDIEGATERHLRALALAPDDHRAVESLGLDAEAAGDRTRALRYLRQLLQMQGPDERRLARVRDLHVAEADWKAAIETQRQLLKAAGAGATIEHTTLLGLRAERGYELLRAGDADAARTVAKELVAEDPGFEPGQILRGEVEIEAGQTDEATRYWQAGVAATGSVELLRRLANLYLENEQPEDAIRVLREAADTMQGEAVLAARILLGRLYYRLELIDEAAELFEQLSGMVVDSPVIDTYLAKVRRRRQETEEAYELLEETIRRGGVLDPRYRCRECATKHRQHAHRCSGCGRWGTLLIDLSRDTRRAEEIDAPIV